MSFHKYGFHVNRTGDDVFDAIRRLRPGVIKTIAHDIGFWTRVREVHPDLFLVGRLVVPQAEQERFVEDPVQVGRSFAEKILALPVNNAAPGGRPLFDAWESFNEAMPESADPDRKRRYDAFQVAFAERLRAGGFEPVAMNFATGHFRGQDFLEHFPGTLETYVYLGFHEYDWPDMWRLHKQNIEEQGEEGMWLCLRYRRIMDLEGVRDRYGDRHTVLITECGMTQGVVGGPDVGPWHASHPIPPERYWRSLLWYNRELMLDPYVKGACLFVVGATHPWESFEHLGEILDRLVRLAQEGPDEPIPVPVDPEKEWRPPHHIRPSDPAEPTPPALRTLLLQAGEAHQVLQFNPDAALQRRIFADGLVPNSPEFTLEFADQTYLCQRAEHLDTGEVRIYYAPLGLWDRIRYVHRPRE